ncbi:MAG: putative rane protein [Anaerocolumna sp.]|jgi:membrane protein|nr:putative rane protein [Anaerocolumna sp.]
MNILISIYKINKAFNRKIKEDYVTAFSAQAAFFVIISFFPFIMFLLTLIQYLPITETTLITTLTSIFPNSVSTLIFKIVNEIYDKSSGTVISITAITALWSASRGVHAIVKGLNSVYAIKETRSGLKLRIMSSIYTLAFAIMMTITLIILVFGNRLYIWIESRIPIFRNLALLIISIRTIAGLLILTVFFLLIYIVIPNRKTNLFRELPGALVSAAGWMGFSYLYSFYIDNMSNYSNTYGSLTAIVLFMLWFYFCMNILFIGGEVNVVLSSGDLIYFLKYLFKNRKAYRVGSLASANHVQIQEEIDKPLEKIIEKTMSDNNPPNKI